MPPSDAPGWLLPGGRRSPQQPVGTCGPLPRKTPVGQRPPCVRRLQVGVRAPAMRAGRAEELFRDADFPASDASLFFNLSTPLAQFREDITWRRPQVRLGAPCAPRPVPRRSGAFIGVWVGV